MTDSTDDAVEATRVFVVEQLERELGESPEAWRGAGVIADLVGAAVAASMHVCMEDDDILAQWATLMAAMGGMTGIVVAVHTHPAYGATKGRRRD